MLGAPFWFDLLGKVAQLRGAGPPTAGGAQATPAAPPTVNITVGKDAAVVTDGEKGTETGSG